MKNTNSNRGRKFSHMGRAGLYLDLLFSLTLIPASCEKQKSPAAQELALISNIYFDCGSNDTIFSMLDNLHVSKEDDYETYISKQLLYSSVYIDNAMLEEAEKILDELEIDPGKSTAYYNYQSTRCLLEYRKDNFDTAFRMIVDLLAQDTPDKRTYALNQRLLGHIYYTMSDFNNSQFWYHQSMKSFEELGMKSDVATTKRYVSRPLLDTKQCVEAEKQLLEAEAMYPPGCNTELFYVYINLSNVYSARKDTLNYLTYIKKAEDTVRGVENKKVLAVLYSNRAQLEMMLGNCEKAIEQLKKIPELGMQYTDANLILRFTWYLLAKCYNEINQPGLARESVERGLEIVNNKSIYLNLLLYRELANSYAGRDPVKRDSLINVISQLSDEYRNSQSINLITLLDKQQEADKLQSELIRQRKKARNINVLGTVTTTLILILLLITLYLLYNQSNKMKLYRQAAKKFYRKTVSGEKSSKTESAAKKDSPEELEKFKNIYSDFIDWLEKDDNYLRSDLSLSLIAGELETNRSYLSRAISGEGKRYQEIVNKYRIDEAERILSNQDHRKHNYSLVVLAAELGFNSQSVFFEAFRKQTGMTPAQYRSAASHSETEH